MFEDFDVDADRIRLRILMEMNFMLTVEERISSCDATQCWKVESNTCESMKGIMISVCSPCLSSTRFILNEHDSVVELTNVRRSTVTS